jgi:hypothetical protein
MYARHWFVLLFIKKIVLGPQVQEGKDFLEWVMDEENKRRYEAITSGFFAFKGGEIIATGKEYVFIFPFFSSFIKHTFTF